MRGFNNIHLWLITHNHEDHLDIIGLSKISTSAEIVWNKNASKILQKSGKNGLTALNLEANKTFRSIKKLKQFPLSME